MYRPCCPYCGHSDGNDDRVIDSRYHKQGDDLILELLKECDICYKRYIVRQEYELKYEELEIGESLE